MMDNMQVWLPQNSSFVSKFKFKYCLIYKKFKYFTPKTIKGNSCVLDFFPSFFSSKNMILDCFSLFYFVFKDSKIQSQNWSI